MSVCEAHNLLTENVTHLRGSIGDLYDLHRETAKDIALIQSGNVEMKADIHGLIKSIHDWKIEIEAQQRNMCDNNNSHIDAIREQIQDLKPKRWTPQHTVALVGALFGAGGGVTAIVLVLIGG